jgi:hypothetical protein
MQYKGFDVSLRLLHQVGHNAKWNIQSFEDSECGHGLILSPLHQSKDSVERLNPATRAASMFDPQFYLPGSQKPKLLQYPFFPESIGGGFKTSSFKSHAIEIAKQCLEFQKGLGFRQLVIPTRFIDQMYSDYVDRQRAFTVDAFLEVAGNESLTLSLAVTAAMIEDHGFRTKLLNWITSYPTVNHVYLMYQQARDTKQIIDSGFLRSAHDFFSEIRSTGLTLTVGYTNSECLMFSILDDIELTIGAFENTRIFSIDKFLVSEEERRGPKARIYLPGLLNWVQFGDAREIRLKAPKVWQAVYSATEHSEQALAQAIEPTFNQPPLYKHYFQVMHQEFKNLDAMDRKSRIQYLKSQVEAARQRYQEIQNANIYLERHGQGRHLAGWSDYLNGFKA